MAKEDHIVQIKQGVKVWNKWRKENPDIVPDFCGADLDRADLRGADLSGAKLNEANLRSANLSGADLSGAKLNEANLSSANLSSADLSGAKLNEANLRSANLSGAKLTDANLKEANLRGADLYRAKLTNANLRGADLYRAKLGGADLSGANFSTAVLGYADLAKANLCGADLRAAALIDSRLDYAELSGAKLWETQRSDWSIKGVTCRRVFWDRNAKEEIEYEDGAFERIFAEKPRIVLHYASRISLIDLAMLPLIVESLQADHPNSALRIRSVQDNGSGATVTITVDDLAGRSDEAVAQDVEAMRGDLATFQQRLHREERLRLEFEAKYSAMVEDILPKLLEKALSKNEVHVGQITGPTIIEGISMSGDTNINQGQAAIVGRDGHAHDMTFQQLWNQSNIDLPRLAEELAKLHAAMKRETEGTREQDKAIVAVADAEEAASKGDGPTALRYLKTAGKWTLGIATQIGVPTAVEAIKRAM